MMCGFVAYFSKDVLRNIVATVPVAGLLVWHCSGFSRKQ